ncbi:MAG: hypothetical protein ACM357_10795, partial [Gemmatimonadota bacterium]
MIFEHPILLVVAPLVALVTALWMWYARRRRLVLARAWSQALERTVRARGRWSPFLFAAVALLAVVALAGPRGGRTSVTTEARSLSMVL